MLCRLASDAANPSVDNFSSCARRRPSGALAVSVKSIWARSAMACADDFGMRSPQTSYPAGLAGGNAKVSGFAAPLEIEITAKVGLAVTWR